MQLEEILSFFAKYIEKELGIIYSEHNSFQLQNRLEEIAHAIGISSIEQLYEEAKTGINGRFKQLLLDIATNNETSFFRDPKVFRALETTVLNSTSELVTKDEPLRIWSAASSTGQEALSIALLIQEHNDKHSSKINYAILGTDISERVLEKAKSATYSQLEVDRGLPPTYLAKYFKKGDQEKWVALPQITKNTEFKKLNLKDALSFQEKFHVILCRNVLIYQNIEGKRDIVRRITSALIPRGYLILGAGESLFGISSDYDQHTVEGAILYRKKAEAHLKTGTEG